MAENFYTILTAIGKAKLANSAVLGVKVNFKTLKVGDGNGDYYEPTENQTSLLNEVWQGNINSIYIDEKNPNWIVTETVISATQGGFFIREAGIFDEDGALIAVSKLSETYKPMVSEGSIKNLYIKIILEVNNSSNITLKTDPTDIALTNEDIQILESKILLINSELSTPIYSKYVSTFNDVIKLDVENNKQVMVDIEGNTIVNLLGNEKECEDVSKWIPYECTLSLDSNNKVFGNNGMKLTLSTSNIGDSYKEITPIIDASKYYCLSGYCKNGNANTINIGFYNGLTRAACSDVSDSNNFVRTWLKLKPADYGATINQIVCTVVGTSEQYGYFDGLMLEEITLEQYNDSNYAPSPYINSDMSVGEIATRIKTRGKNLLPNIICWPKTGVFSQMEFPTNDSIQISINSSCTASVSITIPVKSNTTYTFSYICNIVDYIDNNGAGAYYNIYGMPDLVTKSGITYNSTPYAKTSGINNISKTFTTGANEKYICIVLGVDNDYGTFIFDKVQLEEGSVVTPYKPYEETYLNIDRPLRSLPCGTKDEVKDGKLIKRIEKIVLDGSLDWKIVSNNEGFKTIDCCLPTGTIQNYNFESYKTGARFLKYNNKEIPRGDSTNTEGAWIIGESDYTHIRFEIYSDDSGWGDSYVPTSDEIKAYFYGWKMCNSADGTVYSGTGIKSWGNVNKEVNGIIPWTTNTAALPKVTAPDYTPYRLYYQLSTPVITELSYPNLVAFPKGNLIMESEYQSWVRPKITYKTADNEKANMDETIKCLSKTTLRLSDMKQQSKTYSELATMVSANTLVPGIQYILTDYATKYRQPDSLVIKEMAIERLVLTATSTNTFDVICSSLDYPQDIIYYRFDLKLCEDGITHRPGFIIRRIDETPTVLIDCPGDWRTMLWARYLPNQTQYLAGTTLTDYSVWTSGNAILNVIYKAENTLYMAKSANIPTSATDSNVFYRVYEDITVGMLLSDLKVGSNGGSDIKLQRSIIYLEYPTFGIKCSKITFKQVANDYMLNTVFGSYCSNNTFGSGCGNNTFGNYCSNNTFGGYCNNNIFRSLGRSGCSSNTFGSYCQSNTFGSVFANNTLGSSANSNIFGSNCFCNTFGSGMNTNIFGNNCCYNTFGSGMSSNIFGSNKQYLFVKYLKSKNISAVLELESRDYTTTIEKRSDLSTVYWSLDSTNTPIYTVIA